MSDRPTPLVELWLSVRSMEFRLKMFNVLEIKINLQNFREV